MCLERLVYGVKHLKWCNETAQKLIANRFSFLYTSALHYVNFRDAEVLLTLKRLKVIILGFKYYLFFSSHLPVKIKTAANIKIEHFENMTIQQIKLLKIITKILSLQFNTLKQ